MCLIYCFLGLHVSSWVRWWSRKFHKRWHASWVSALFLLFFLLDTSFKLSAFLALVSFNVVFAIQNVLVGHVFNLKIIFEVILLDPHILPLCLGTLGLDLIRSLQKLPWEKLIVKRKSYYFCKKFCLTSTLKETLGNNEVCK